MSFLKETKIKELKEKLTNLPYLTDPDKLELFRYILSELKVNNIEPEEIGIMSQREPLDFFSLTIEEMALYLIKLATTSKTPLDEKIIWKVHIDKTPGSMAQADNLIKMVIKRIQKIIDEKGIRQFPSPQPGQIVILKPDSPTQLEGKVIHSVPFEVTVSLFIELEDGLWDTTFQVKGYEGKWLLGSKFDIFDPEQ